MNLKQLSEYLGLSQTTISRALNGYPEVSEKTRLRVMDAAAKTGYLPNASARRLATGKLGSIGLVMPIDRDHRSDVHFTEFLQGLGEEAAKADYNLVIKPSPLGLEEDALKDLAVAGSVDGVFFAYMRVNDPRIASMKKLKIPYLVHGRSYGSDDDFPYLDVDNEQAFFDATNLLIQLGHRRIAFLNGPKILDFAHRRELGLRKACYAGDIAVDPDHVFHGSMNDEDGFHAVQRLMETDRPPTAILCASTVTALGVVRALNQKGLKIGKDVSVIAHDDVLPLLKPENFSVPLTTTRSSLREAGQRVAKRLFAQIEGDLTYPRQEIWRAELILRASTGPAPQT